MIKLFLSILVVLPLIAGCTSQAEDKTSVIDNKEHPFKSVSIFVYHRFGDDRYPSTNISLPVFEEHLKYLQSEHYIVMTLSDAIDYMQNDDVPANKKVAVITVDDGYKSFQTGAMPLLKKYGFTATLYINTETVGATSYLTWAELKSIASADIEIGNHTHSHAYFVDLPKENRYKVFKEDIQLAQSLIKEHLKINTSVFAYPYGELDTEMEDVVRSLSFKGAVAQNSGAMHSNGNYFSMPRFPMASNFATLNRFKEKINMTAPVVEGNPEAHHVVHSNTSQSFEIALKGNNINKNSMQCFNQAGDCEVLIVNESPLRLKFIGKSPLKKRRTLYTLTYTDKEGQWYWYSQLFIKSNTKE